MSAGSRIAIVLVAVVALVVGFAALRPSGDEPSPAPEVATAPADAPTTVTAAEEEAPPTTATTPPEPEVPTIRTRGGKPLDGVRKLEFEAGDDIVFRVRSDIAEEIHVHGYDTYVDLAPGRTTTVRIEDAGLEGVFEVELHGSATPIAELAVKPS